MYNSCLFEPQYDEILDDIDFYPPEENDTTYDDFNDYENLGLADCLPEDF